MTSKGYSLGGGFCRGKNTNPKKKERQRGGKGGGGLCQSSLRNEGGSQFWKQGKDKEERVPTKKKRKKEVRKV